MSNESKRITILIVGAMLWIFAAQYLGERLGWFPKKVPKAPAVAQAGAAPAVGKAEAPEVKNPPVAAAAPNAPVVERVAAEDLLLAGPAKDEDYWVRAQLSQEGAGVRTLELTQHEAERAFRRDVRKPLKIVDAEPGAVPSFALAEVVVRDAAAKGDVDGATYPLDKARWEVVRSTDGKVVHPILDPKSNQEIGREASFRTSLGDPEVIVTKSFRLLKKVEGLGMTLRFESPRADRTIVYRLDGPRGMPIEGEWYTSIFREVFIGLAKGDETQVETRAASDVVAKELDPEVFQTLPVRYFGVENQYFAVLAEPDPEPTSEKSRIDEETIATVVRGQRQGEGEVRRLGPDDLARVGPGAGPADRAQVPHLRRAEDRRRAHPVPRAGPRVLPQDGLVVPHPVCRARWRRA